MPWFTYTTNNTAYFFQMTKNLSQEVIEACNISVANVSDCQQEEYHTFCDVSLYDDRINIFACEALTQELIGCLASNLSCETNDLAVILTVILTFVGVYTVLKYFNPKQEASTQNAQRDEELAWLVMNK